jgi:hypothetical protein
MDICIIIQRIEVRTPVIPLIKNDKTDMKKMKMLNGAQNTVQGNKYSNMTLKFVQWTPQKSKK